mgnify:CR=1 FL=1
MKPRDSAELSRWIRTLVTRMGSPEKVKGSAAAGAWWTGRVPDDQAGG